jgi:hypothetical protein
MTYAEWMKKQAEGSPTETPQQSAAKRPLSSGEIGWGVLGGSGGALLGWTLARLLHRKPSLRTKLLYSVLGAAGGVGGSHYLMTHMKDSQGLTPAEHMQNAQKITEDGGSIVGSEKLTPKEHEAAQHPEKIPEINEELARERAEKYKVPEGVLDGTSNKRALIGGAILGGIRGASIDPGITSDKRGKRHWGVVTFPGRYVTSKWNKHYGHKVNDINRENRALMDMYKGQQQIEADLVKTLQGAVDSTQKDYQSILTPGASLDPKRLSQMAFEQNTTESAYPDRRIYKGHRVLLDDKGKVQLENPTTDEPELQKIPERPKYRIEAAARTANAVANAATHAALSAGANAAYKHWIYQPLARKYPTLRQNLADFTSIAQRAVQIANEQSGNN